MLASLPTAACRQPLSGLHQYCPGSVGPGDNGGREGGREGEGLSFAFVHVCAH